MYILVLVVRFAAALIFVWKRKKQNTSASSTLYPLWFKDMQI